MQFIITSNLFMLLPIGAALYVHDLGYFYIGLLAIVSSSLFHTVLADFPNRKNLLQFSRGLDWTVAIFAYGYMFFYVFTKSYHSLRIPLILGLVATLLFFWYGFKLSDYKRLHPWFHVITSFVSTIVVLSI
ncbi:MAG: hypothetical protein KA052_00745 [Candidatus Pacebacteria bacterium]|nr:hypothetical protein [Candidatus Paceibacterota bacterium]